jgi:2-dehydro-3-deoxyphosphogluconate aldolase/(4S)-4-hydroxy-2-oxoglutarate aldolase
MMSDTFNRIALSRIVPIVEIDNAADAAPVAQTLLEAGLTVVEVVARTSQAFAAVESIAANVGDITVGAGTLLSPAMVDRAIDSGAAFGVAPGIGLAADRAISRKFPFVPGAVTPTEVTAALDVGLRHVKFFPASNFGGPAALKALCGPFNAADVRFMPTGGIKPHDAPAYLEIAAVFAVGGTWIAPRADIAAHRWDVIGKRARTAAALVTNSMSQAQS